MSRKRGQGEGSIYKHKDRMWVAAISAQGRRVVKYFKTRHDAQDWLQEARNQIQSGLTFLASQITVRDYLLQWLSGHENSIRPKTAHQYGQIINQHIAPIIGKLKLKDLRPDQIQALYAAESRAGRSQRSILLEHAVLHRALDQALRWGLIGRNPAQAVSRPKIRRKEMLTLSQDQVKVFLDAARWSRHQTLYWLAVTTGLRQGEILGLKWSDLDWMTRRLKVQRQLQRTKTGGNLFTDPKSEAGRRSVVLSRITISKLRAQRAVLSYERLFAGARWKDNDLIFPSTLGTPLDLMKLHKDFKGILHKAQLPNLRFHDLRHTAATLMLAQGIHPKVVQERLGHADIALTLNTYSHVLPDIQEEAAEKLDQLFTPMDSGGRSGIAAPKDFPQDFHLEI
jgi:integrase